MQTPIRYPVGIQDFTKLRTGNYLYVDKTRFVYDLANNYDYVFLSRPRRFGKSLLISTFEEYFKGNRELFVGLDIDRMESEWESYPVLRFDLSGESFLKPQDLITCITQDLIDYENRYGIVPTLTDNEDAIGTRFYSLLKQINIKTGKRIVVLVDEYDKPMLESLHDDPLHNELKARLRGFYSVLKKCDGIIRFAMLTGVTKFGKVSIFSGLNNLKDISMKQSFNEICGISEDELHNLFSASIDDFAHANGITEAQTREQFKHYYDGYHFSKNGKDIYNPYSTLNAFKDKELGKYWFTSGSSEYLVRLIERHPFVLDRLEGAERSEEELSDITDLSRDIVPLLYQAGYLTIRSYDSVSELYTLGFPNEEVRKGFWNSMASYFFRPKASTYLFSIEEFMRDLMQGEAEGFMTRLQSMFAALGSEKEPDKEVHFQNIVAIFVQMLGFRTTTELHSSQGRCDIVIEAPQFIYLLELKVDSTPEKAMTQIHEKGYARPYKIDPRRKILIGANFSTKTRTLTGWIIE